MDSINIKAYTSDSSKIEAIKAVMKALKIKFEVSREEDYNPDFVAKIEKSRQQYKKGEFVSVEKKDIKSFLGLE